MSELRFRIDGLTRRRRIFRRLARAGSGVSALPSIAAIAATPYILVVASQSVLAPLAQREATQVSYSSAFAEETTSGASRFQISVSPVDADGQLITAGVGVNNFSFSPLSISQVGDQTNIIARGNANPNDLSITYSSGQSDTRVMMLLDSSGSMEDNDPSNLRHIAAKRFVGRLSDVVDIAVMDFAGLRQDFTQEEDDLREAIDAVGAEHATPLYSTLEQAIDRLKSGDGAENSIVLALTDGEADDDGLPEIIASAKATGTRIVSLGLGQDPHFGDLQVLATQTGGSFVRAAQADQLYAFFDALATSIDRGRITVQAQARFDKELSADRQYVIAGTLFTELAGETTSTPFQFVASPQKESHTSN